MSAGMHIALFAFLYFGLPHIIPPLPPHRTAIPIDIVTIAEITNTRAEKAPPQKAPPPPKEKPVEKQAAEPVPVPKPPPPKEPVQAESLAPPDMAKAPKKQAPAKEQAPQRDLLGSVLKNVAKMKAAMPPAEKAEAESDAEANADDLAPLDQALSNRLSITEEDALRRQIEQCWNPPIGARDAEDLVVEVIISVNPDRTVAETEIVDKLRYASDSFFRAAADAAVRALRNPKCSPLELAPEKYQQWKRINFVFDPRDML